LRGRDEMTMRRWLKGKVFAMGAVAVLTAGTACGDDPVKSGEDATVGDTADIPLGELPDEDVDDSDATTTPDAGPIPDATGDEGEAPDALADATPTDTVQTPDTPQFPDLAPDTTS